MAEAEIESLKSYRRQCRAWIETHLEPSAPVAHSGPGYTRNLEAIAEERKLQRLLYESGYAGIDWPLEYGGQGLTREHRLTFESEAIEYRTPEFGIIGQTTFEVCVPTMIEHASPAFLRQHIPRVLAGDELWVQLFSEPEAGSDLAGVRTSAEKTETGWSLTGGKMWTSVAHLADYGMCLARTDWQQPKHRGLTWFAVPMSARGVTILPIRKIDNSADLWQEFFDGVELGALNVIGEVNDGWSVTQTMLALERGGGSRAGAHDERNWPPTYVVDLVALALRSGRIDEYPVQQLLSQAYVNDCVYEAMMFRIAALTRSAPRDGAGIASHGKLAGGMFSATRARIALEIGGSHALTWPEADEHSESEAAHNYLNGRMRSIAGGTNEMQRNSISERVLGLPREPSYETDRPYDEVIHQAKSWVTRP